MEYKNITFVTGFPMVVVNKSSKSVIMHVFFKEDNSLILNQIVEDLTDIFKGFNVSVYTKTSVAEIITMINYEVFKCGMIIELYVPNSVEINVNTLETMQNAIPVIIKLAKTYKKLMTDAMQSTKTLKCLNQVHPPRKKSVTKDVKGNDRNRLWIKDGNTTMLLTSGITKNAAEILKGKILSFLEACELKTSITFLLTK